MASPRSSNGLESISPSRNIYGEWIDTAPRLLVVGPATEPAASFHGFCIPVFPRGSSLDLPGAPRAVELLNPQELVATPEWMARNWPSKIHEEARRMLLRYFEGVGFAYCISFPVIGPQANRKEAVGVVNINTRRIPRHVTREMLDHVYDILKPILVHMGWLEWLHHRSAAAPNKQEA